MTLGFDFESASPIVMLFLWTEQ